MKVLTIGGKYIRTPNGIAKANIIEPQIYATRIESEGDECPDTLNPNDVYFTLPVATVEGQREPQVGDFLVYDHNVANASGNKQILCEITSLDDRGDPYRYGVNMRAICFIPAAVADSGGGASENKLALLLGTQDATNKPYEITAEDMGDATSITQYQFYGKDGLKKIDMPDVTSIGTYAFYHCDALEEARMPNVTEIATQAFKYCKALTSVNLPNVTEIDSYVFENCSGLISVNIPNVTSVGSYGFSKCKSLTSISLPSVTGLTSYAFSECSNLTEVDMPSATSIGQGAFKSCNALTSVNMPKAQRLIATAFNACKSLTSVNLPSVTTLDQSAFYQCSKLTSVTIGANCTSIATKALNCGSAEYKVTYRFEGTTPPAITSDSINWNYTERVEVKVGYGETYKTATNFASGADKIVEVDF